jgi:hypothetical protein
MHIKTCVSSMLCNEVKELIIVDHWLKQYSWIQHIKAYLMGTFQKSSKCYWLVYFTMFMPNSWKFSHNFIFRSMRILIGAPNLLKTLLKNAHVVIARLWSSNGTNSNHLDKCLIITKTCCLCYTIKLNSLAKSKLHK